MKSEPEPEKKDIYQERYEAHQARKAKVLKQIMEERHSNRIFSDKPLDHDKHIAPLLEAIDLCPSSCSREAIYSQLITERDEKALLGGVLVGGVGWIHRATAIILLFAEPTAYKAGDEIKFMPL